MYQILKMNVSYPLSVYYINVSGDVFFFVLFLGRLFGFPRVASAVMVIAIVYFVYFERNR